jgi:cell division protein FtsL
LRQWIAARKSLYILAITLVLALAGVSCTTTFLETSGNMTNQKSSRQDQSTEHTDRDVVAPPPAGVAGAACRR